MAYQEVCLTPAPPPTWQGCDVNTCGQAAMMEKEIRSHVLSSLSASSPRLASEVHQAYNSLNLPLRNFHLSLLEKGSWLQVAHLHLLKARGKKTSSDRFPLKPIGKQILTK